jgi:hypothetical protein
VLRAGGHRGAARPPGDAPSTLGTFLRSFTFGHVRRLDPVLGRRSGGLVDGGGSRVGAPGGRRRSFIGELHGYGKQGAGFGYTGERGYHPLLATRAGSGEVLRVACARVSQASEGIGRSPRAAPSPGLRARQTGTAPTATRMPTQTVWLEET